MCVLMSGCYRPHASTDIYKAYYSPSNAYLVEVLNDTLWVDCGPEPSTLTSVVSLRWFSPDRPDAAHTVRIERLTDWSLRNGGVQHELSVRFAPEGDCMAVITKDRRLVLDLQSGKTRPCDPATIANWPLAQKARLRRSEESSWWVSPDGTVEVLWSTSSRKRVVHSARSEQPICSEPKPVSRSADQ